MSAKMDEFPFLGDSLREQREKLSANRRNKVIIADQSRLPGNDRGEIGPPKSAKVR